MKFQNIVGFTQYKNMSVFLLILCIFVALVFSNIPFIANWFNPKNAEGMMTYGDAASIMRIIEDGETSIWQKLVQTYSDPVKYDTISGILSDGTSATSQFSKIRTQLQVNPNPPVLSDINLTISKGYKDILKTLMTSYGTNVEINPSLTQGCDGAESCIINTKAAASSQSASTTSIV